LRSQVQYFDLKMPTLVRATALAAVAIPLSDVSSAAACRHFSIWHFPWPQPCPAKQIGGFISRWARLFSGPVHGARRADCRRWWQRGGGAALRHQHRSGQDRCLHIVRPAFEPCRVCADSADRRGRADRRERLRVAGDRRRGYRWRELVRRRWKSAYLAHRRADAWRFTERADAHERPVVLVICSLRRGRHPRGLCRSARPSSSMTEWARTSRAACRSTPPSESPFGISETIFTIGYAPRTGGPAWKAGSKLPGAHIFEMIMRQIPCMRLTCALRPD
jgi:hypothetical protein